MQDTTQQDTTQQHVIVFGGTGKVGRLAVADALERGHIVTVFGRHPEALDIDHPNLRFFRGDVLDVAAVTRAVRDQHAVICALGRPLRDGSKLRTRGTANIVAAMKATGVTRLICLTVMGLGESWHNLSWTYRRIILPTLLSRVVADHRDQEQLIMNSDLEWTLVRPPNMTDAEPAANVRHGFGADAGPVSAFVPRVDVARYLVDQVAATDHMRDAVAITAAA